MPQQDPSPRSRAAASHLETQVSYRLGVPLIYIKGELDHDSAPYLRDVISEETREHPANLVLEISELTYMDSGGLSVMFDTAAMFKAPRWLGLSSPNAGVRRLLEVTGMDDHPNVKIFPDLRSVQRVLSEAETP